MSAAGHYLLALVATSALGLLWMFAERLAGSREESREDSPHARCGQCGCAGQMHRAEAKDQTNREEA